MGVYVSHTTALWLRASPLNLAPRLRELEPLGRSTLQNASASIVDVRSDVIPAFAEVLGTDGSGLGPIDVLVGSGAERRGSEGIREHRWKNALPRGSFDLLCEGVFLATPEFSFLQLAGELNDIQLLTVGYAICGCYWPTNSKRGFTDHLPLTDTFKIKEYLATVPKGTFGLNRAKRVADLIIDGSRSPMESATAMVLSLRQSRGGWGAPRPQMNVEVKLSEDMQETLGQKRCYVDLCWPEAHFGIEYNGEGTHPLAGQDIARQMALEEMGMRVQLITKAQIRDVRQSFLLANKVRRLMHRNTIEMPDDARAQEELKSLLLTKRSAVQWLMPTGYR